MRTCRSLNSKNEWSGRSSCKHSCNRPCLVTTIFAKPFWKCVLNVVMKSCCKGPVPKCPQPLFPLPRWTIPQKELQKLLQRHFGVRKTSNDNVLCCRQISSFSLFAEAGQKANRGIKKPYTTHDSSWWKTGFLNPKESEKAFCVSLLNR